VLETRECPLCGCMAAESDIAGVEYWYTSPNHYDGASEWVFPCGHRVGRWTGKPLALGEEEPRYGGKKG